MSRWVSITADMLREQKVDALTKILRNAALGQGQTDRAPAIIADVVAQVRRKIGSHSGNQLDANATTVPVSLKQLTVDLTLYALKIALDQPLSEDERDARRDYLSDLNRIASGADSIEQPDDAAGTPEVQTGGDVAVFNAPPRQTGRERSAGL